MIYGIGNECNTEHPEALPFFETIAQTVRTLLEAPTYRTQAKAIARDFRSCPGPKGAADKILQVCGGEISPEN